MNMLPLAKRVQILSSIIEGCSLRSTSRMAHVSINTVTKLLVDVGKACSDYQNQAMKGLACKRLEIDEIWLSEWIQRRSCRDRNIDARNALPFGTSVAQLPTLSSETPKSHGSRTLPCLQLRDYFFSKNSLPTLKLNRS